MRPAPPGTRLTRDARGSVAVEYAVVLGVVAVVASLAIATLGAPLVRLFIARVEWLRLPVP